MSRMYPGKRTKVSKRVATRRHVNSGFDGPARGAALRNCLEKANATPFVCEWWGAFAASVVLIIGLWVHWPTLASHAETWIREPDYSHGFFVIPLAGYMLWHRRNRFPGCQMSVSWMGLLLVCVGAGVNVAGSFWFIEPLRAWSLPIWIAGVCWFFCGWRVLRWSLPAIAFLGFMIPLPYRVETFLTVPLQRTATQLSCWLLVMVGQPAIAEGNVISINDARLAVAEACSGLRIFVSIIALAFVVAVFSENRWWMKTGLFLAILPIALLANAVRIAATGLLQVYVSDDAAHRFAHDASGWAMIVFAAALFSGVFWYIGRLIVEMETVSAGELLSRDRLTTTH